MTIYTLSEAIEDFLRRYQSSPQTQDTYRVILRWIPEYVGGGLALDAITPLDIERAIAAYEARPTVNSVYTVNKLVKNWKTFFNWCVDVEKIQRSPARALMKRSEPNNDVLERTMPEHVYYGLLDHFTEAVKFDAKRFLRMLCLLHVAGTGARRAGIAGLRWQDINFAKKEAWVTEKGEKTRVIYFSVPCIQVLREWQLLQKNEKGDFVFSKTGRTISANALGKFFRDYCHDAGFDKGGPDEVRGWGLHAIRHLIAILMQDAGVNEVEVAGIMGHAISTYRAYYASQDTTRLRASSEKRYRLIEARRKTKVKSFFSDATREINASFSKTP
ncbi:MAG: tyrosine-type recombinase/integrase [Chloroflexota bacterium]